MSRSEDDDQPATIEFVESSDPFDTFTYGLTAVVFQGRTRYQNVVIADTFNYGRALMLDGAIQSAEDDERLYHEMLVQPAMLRHPNPRDVLIIGGGEGATLREVLIHGVETVTMVDLDEQVVQLCREHLRGWHRGAFDDPRVRLSFEDGRAFVEKDTSLYDIAIIDVVDMLDNGPAQRLYTREFYAALKARLRPGAIVVVQALEFSFLDWYPHTAIRGTLTEVFSEVHSYRVHIPSFLSSWGFITASDWFRPADWSVAEIDGAIDEKVGQSYFAHITGEFIRGSFALCRSTRSNIGRSVPPLEDHTPFAMADEPDDDVTDTSSEPLMFPLKNPR